MLTTNSNTSIAAGARNIDRLSGAEAIETLKLAEELYAGLSTSVTEIYESHPGLVAAARAAEAIATTTPTLSDAVGGAIVQVDQLGEHRVFSGTTATWLVLLSILLLATIGVRFNGSRARQRQAQQQAEAMKAEVQRKVTEIEPLAAGNLSRDLTVTEGIVLECGGRLCGERMARRLPAEAPEHHRAGRRIANALRSS